MGRTIEGSTDLERKCSNLPFELRIRGSTASVPTNLSPNGPLYRQVLARVSEGEALPGRNRGHTKLPAVVTAGMISPPKP